MLPYSHRLQKDFKMKASRINVALVVMLSFGVFVTITGGIYYLVPNLLGPGCQIYKTCTVTSKSGQPGPTLTQYTLFLVGTYSIPLASSCWLGFGALWVWRGRNSARWNTLGLDRNVFDLFTRMRGAGTRTKLLEALSEPADRLQLAKKTRIEWKAVDRHIKIMLEHRLVQENVAYGNVRMYQLTPLGTSLLGLLKSFDEAENSPSRSSP